MIPANTVHAIQFQAACNTLLTTSDFSPGAKQLSQLPERLYSSDNHEAIWRSAKRTSSTTEFMPHMTQTMLLMNTIMTAHVTKL